MKKLFLSLALVVTPILHASQNYHDHINIVCYPSPIIQQENIHIPANYTLVYANPYNPENYIYPASILKGEKLTGKGNIYIDSNNTLIIAAQNMNKFKGHIYCHLSACLIVYTQTNTQDLKYIVQHF